jgi:hypothetical protein
MRAHEHIKFWHDTTLSNLELLRATDVTHAFAPHTHETYTNPGEYRASHVMHRLCGFGTVRDGSAHHKLAALLVMALPLKLGIALAALVGIAVGLTLELKKTTSI